MLCLMQVSGRLLINPWRSRLLDIEEYDATTDLISENKGWFSLSLHRDPSLAAFVIRITAKTKKNFL